MVTAMAAGLLVNFAGGRAEGGELLGWWAFDEDGTGVVRDSALQSDDPVIGPVAHVAGVSGKAIKLDGFRSHIRRECIATTPEGAFTVEAWVALAAYPWSWAPVLDINDGKDHGIFFGIGPEGKLRFRIMAGGSWHEATCDQEVPLRQWTHLAAVHQPGHKLAVFINGVPVAESEGLPGAVDGAENMALTIGRTSYPQLWREPQLASKDSHFFLDGLIDELKIHDVAKTAVELKQDVATRGALPPPALSERGALPVGPRGDGGFGAYYTRLDYYPEWDAMWRVGGASDVFVRFDDSPVQLVFWRGASYVPCWVNENGIWYTNEWLETWGRDVQSCAEPIMDRDCRFSHVRILENTGARVVVHWRYALNDAFYKFVAVGDDGRGEWCDEYHIIYPDGVGVRKIDLHYTTPERKHDWVEQIVVLPPGKFPDDTVEHAAITLVNMDGASRDYSWHDPDFAVEMPEPQGANISLVNMKSAYRPFIVVPPGPVDTVEGTWNSPFFRSYAAKMATPPMRPANTSSVYGWWNHWPVAQIPGDGRWVTRPDKPSHFTLTTFVQWQDHAKSEKTRTRIMLQGMTKQTAAVLVPVAKSWLAAPEMKLAGSGFSGGGYDRAERAYVAECVTPLSTMECTLNASADSPLLNPAFIIRNWGDRKAVLTIDDEVVADGKDFKQGIRKQAQGTDLILWIRLDKRQPVKLVLK